ncbi:ricin-type beta-trefoil lectin domain protein [Streptomyces sp. NPDC006670]|uniref:ricin-type beta-trefoil lectin domain protein n=1 Tax=Streptomyces sp. NPDC006670 TaxID=3154476 RepID=UPI0033EB57FB
MPRPPAAPRAPPFGQRTTWVAAAAAVVLLATAGFPSTVLSGHGHSAASGTSGQPAPPANTAPSPSTTPPSTTRAGTPPPPPGDVGGLHPHGGPAPPPPGPIGNTGSGLCVDTNGPQRSGLEVVLRSCANFTGQIGSYDRTSLHLLHLTNTPSGMCLDTNGAPSAGVAAVINPCGRYSGRQRIYDATGGRFTDPVSGLCLDTNGPRPSTPASSSTPAERCALTAHRPGAVEAAPHPTPRGPNTPCGLRSSPYSAPSPVR